MEDLANTASFNLFKKSQLALQYDVIIKTSAIKYRTVHLYKLFLSQSASYQTYTEQYITDSSTWKYEYLINKDIPRIEHLKKNTDLHLPIKSVIEYYC
jgi:hypothetical protein